MTGMPRGVTHSTAEPECEMSRALSVSQCCGHRARGSGQGPVRGSLPGPGRERGHTWMARVPENISCRLLNTWRTR